LSSSLSGDVAVLVDESAEDPPSPDRVDGDRVRHRLIDRVGCSLVDAPVGAVRVVALDVLFEDPAELPNVADECVVGEFGAH